MSEIAYLINEVNKFIHERKWEKYHHPKEIAMSIAIEAAELMELFQWDDKVPIDEIKQNDDLMNKIESEIADIMVYLLSFVSSLDISLEEVVCIKLDENRRKYNKEHVLTTGAYRKDKL